MFCTQCGKNLKDGTKFCTGCGAVVKQKAPMVESNTAAFINEPEPSPAPFVAPTPEPSPAPFVAPTPEPSPAPFVAPTPEPSPIPFQTDFDSFQNQIQGGYDGNNINREPVKIPEPVYKPPKSNVGFMIVIICLILLILGVGVAGFFLLGGTDMLSDIMGTGTINTSSERESRHGDKDAADEEDDDNDNKGNDADNGNDNNSDSDTGMNQNNSQDMGGNFDNQNQYDNGNGGLYEEGDDGKINMQQNQDDNGDQFGNTSVKSEYILENSDTQRLSKSDLEGLTKEQCRLARNELYARHGRLFDDEGLQSYFDSCSWYYGHIDASKFSESMLNDIEVYNRDLIVEYEKDMGYR